MNHFYVANQEHWRFQIQNLHNLTELISLNTLQHQHTGIRTEIISILSRLTNCPPSFHFHLIGDGLIEMSEILVNYFEKDQQVYGLISSLLASFLKNNNELVRRAWVPLLLILLNSRKEEELIGCIHMIEDHLSVEEIFKFNLLEPIFDHLTSPSLKIQLVLLQFLLDIIKTCSENQIQTLFNKSLVQNLSMIMETPKQDASIINNMLALLYSIKTFNGIENAFSELLPHVLHHLLHLSAPQQKLALVVLVEYTSLLKENQVRYLVENGIIDLLLTFLESSSDLIVNISLECLVNIVRTGSIPNKFNLYSIAIQECISLDKLKSLKSLYFNRRTRDLLDLLIQQLQKEN